MKLRFIWLGIVSVFAVSCHTVKEVAVKKEVPAISENRLLKNIEAEALDYRTLYAKRTEVTWSDGKKTDSFKASVKIRRDSFIQVSLTAPLGIEVARILLTPDSIKFADTYHKKYFFADYSYLYEKFDVNIGFDCIQGLLTNDFFNFGNCGGIGKNRKFKFNRTETGYELSTLEERALGRKIKKLYKKKRKNKDYILILQKIAIDPQFFRPLSMSVEDVEEDMGVSVHYRNFKVFSERQFPETIVFKLFSEDRENTLELKFMRLEFDVPVEANFKISSKYKRL